ncbi:endo-1,4-beta-xylanase [Kolteria novifilia]|uniref:endo-1,4-beta-xylanase n=1 Tax=Kolteria novifilia TaxID=2527975 RepID=UPI003AF36846
MQLIEKTAKPLRKGDVCLLSFWARRAPGLGEKGAGKVAVYLQKASPNYNKMIDVVVRLDEQWRRFDVPFVADETYPTAAAELGIGFGFGPQVVDVADVNVTNFRQGVAIDSLPRTPFTYPGMEQQAQWRRQANERIERIRKSELVVEVLDKVGNPVPDAQVSLAQTSHFFPFGTAVEASRLLAQDETSRRYQQELVRLFNRATPENELKWMAVSGAWGPFDRNAVIRCLEWLKNRGISIRGHNLVWPRRDSLPPPVLNLLGRPELLQRMIDKHINEMGALTTPYVTEWDVLNEPVGNPLLVEALGEEAMVNWFKTARGALPKSCRLMVNQDGILTSGGPSDTKRQQEFQSLIAYLIGKGAPLEGVGLESHFGYDVTPPEDLLTILDKLADFGLPLEVTEFTLNVTDEKFQAAYTRDFLTACFSHPAVSGIVLWGFWQGNMFEPNAALYRTDWTLKPNGQVVRDLLLRQWRTETSGKTDASGQLTIRGFRGDYNLTAAKDGKRAGVVTSLTTDSTVKLVLE